MKLKPYEKYKDSGVEWIGEIPEDWGISKIKFFSEIYGRIGFRGYTVNDLVDEGEGAITLSPSNIINQKLILNKVQYISWEKWEESPEIKIFNEDILLVKTASVGKVALVEGLGESATINPQLVVFKNIKINSKFFYYSLISDIIQNQIGADINGGIIGTLKQENINNYYCMNPQLDEQERIVSFLDKKTLAIDRAIEKNKKLIELLEEKRTSLINHGVTKGLDPNAKMKNSGIEWFGEIPEDWNVKKIKEIADIKLSNVDKKSKENESEVLLCNYLDVYYNEFINSELNFMKATASNEQIKKLSLKKGDIIITKDSESPDDIAIPSLVDEKVENLVCGYHLALIRPDMSQINPYFLFKSFESKKINDQFFVAASGVTRFGISTYPIKNSFVLVPSIREQKEISNYILKNMLTIDKLIYHIKNQEILLNEYKSSLIYHVVTGKISTR